MRAKLTLASCVVLLTAACGSSSNNTTTPDAAVSSPDAPASRPDAPASTPDVGGTADAPVSTPDVGGAADAPASSDGATIDAASTDGAATPVDSGTPAVDAPVAAAGTFTWDTGMGQLVMTPIRHASVMFEWAGQIIYVDPAMGTNYPNRPKADVIIITHIHSDHFATDIITQLRKDTTKLYGPANVAAMVTGMTTMANGADQMAGPLLIHALGAYNLTRNLDGHPMGVGNGYLLMFGNKKVYLSGDTECVPDIKALTGIDVALLCMNLPNTMTSQEGAECAKTFAPKELFPYHYKGQDLSVLQPIVGDVTKVHADVNWYPMN